ncbi:ribonuclease HI family protein [Massilia aurea]|uniref:ribonuclease HI family protein n=1 Tax=Massilia aurea TaxID=373040 RepID=UPI0021623740|nr:ribonuclease HI family protein [Massilia aurea]MCS0709621.1 ribonuclease HI family protein [Massilia aurea]
MNDLSLLRAAAFKTELAASQRLMARAGLSELEALTRTLTHSAGLAGLKNLLAERAALRLHAAQQSDRRAALASASRTRGTGAGKTAWRAWFDGSARPNPGRCGIGAVLEGPGGVRVAISHAAGYGNSSEAEYLALIAVLDAAVTHGAHDVLVVGDSQVVIDDVNGPASASAPSLRDYRARACALLERLPQAQLRWIPRHKNFEADTLSQRAVPPLLPETSTC